MTVHKFDQNMAVVSDEFVFGDDFDAILDALEDDDAVQEEFNAAVEQVEKKDSQCEKCGKICRTIAGLKRHITAKHPEENNNGHTESSTLQNCNMLTPAILKSLTENAATKIRNSAVFSKPIQHELSIYQLTELEKCSPQFKILYDIYNSFQKNRDSEKFYASFYASVPLKSRDFFPGLASNAATLLATKLADMMIVHLKELTQKNPKIHCKEVCERELGGLQYIGGYVLHNLHKKYRNGKNWRSLECQHSMAILRACKADDADTSDNRLVACLNRGGLWAIKKELEMVFLITEQYFRAGKSTSGVEKLNFQGIINAAMNDDHLNSLFASVVSEIDICPSSYLVKDLLFSILSLYVRVRCFSHARDIIQQYKLHSRQVRSKGLRAEIKRQSGHKSKVQK